jgi:hypothetical protein
VADDADISTNSEAFTKGMSIQLMHYQLMA